MAARKNPNKLQIELQDKNRNKIQHTIAKHKPKYKEPEEIKQYK